MSSFFVVPHAGTWIEIDGSFSILKLSYVVPHAGTWIEIKRAHELESQIQSFPTRERGLK